MFQIQKGVLLHPIALNFTIIWCPALVKQLKSRVDKKAEQKVQKLDKKLGSVVSVVLFCPTRLSPRLPDTNLLICRAANLVDICREGERWMCTLLSSARI